jgi:hypothetical protein
MDSNNGRRSVLRQLGAAFLSLVGWRVAEASASGTESGVFANLFLQESKSVHVPLGYYDPKTQRYLDSKTHKPIFAPEATEEKAIHGLSTAAETKQLSETDLENLLKSGRFVDAMALEKLRAFGGWCTLSQLTTLSTSGCCPIVTDSSRDTQCDDTTTNPPN